MAERTTEFLTNFFSCNAIKWTKIEEVELIIGSRYVLRFSDKPPCVDYAVFVNKVGDRFNAHWTDVDFETITHVALITEPED